MHALDWTMPATELLEEGFVKEVVQELKGRKVLHEEICFCAQVIAVAQWHLRSTSTVLDLGTDRPADLASLLAGLRHWLTETSVGVLAARWNDEVEREGAAYVDAVVKRSTWMLHLSEFVEEWIQFGHVEEPLGRQGNIPRLQPLPEEVQKSLWERFVRNRKERGSGRGVVSGNESGNQSGKGTEGGTQSGKGKVRLISNTPASVAEKDTVDEPPKRRRRLTFSGESSRSVPSAPKRRFAVSPELE